MGSWYAGRMFCFKITHQPPSKIKWSSLNVNITCGVTDRYHPVSLMLKIITKKKLPKQQYINISWMEFKLVVFAYHIWPFVLFILKYNKKSIFHFTNGICQFRSPEWALGECRERLRKRSCSIYSALQRKLGCCFVLLLLHFNDKIVRAALKYETRHKVCRSGTGITGNMTHA